MGYFSSLTNVKANKNNLMCLFISSIVGKIGFSFLECLVAPLFKKVKIELSSLLLIDLIFALLDSNELDNNLIIVNFSLLLFIILDTN